MLVQGVATVTTMPEDSKDPRFLKAGELSIGAVHEGLQREAVARFDPVCYVAMMSKRRIKHLDDHS